MNYLSNPNKRAVGSSYCIDQAPGAERIGGVTVVLRPRGGNAGTISINPTDRRTGATLSLGAFGTAAERGVRDAASERAISLDDLDVTISDFDWHPNDSRDVIYYGAAKSAFTAAWDAWSRFSGAFTKQGS